MRSDHGISALRAHIRLLWGNYFGKTCMKRAIEPCRDGHRREAFFQFDTAHSVGSHLTQAVGVGLFYASYRTVIALKLVYGDFRMTSDATQMMGNLSGEFHDTENQRPAAEIRADANAAFSGSQQAKATGRGT